MKQGLYIINLAAAFAGAFAITTFLHEGAHAITAYFAGAEPTLFHSYVSYNESGVPKTAQLAITAAGPLASLLQGMVFFRLARTRLLPDWTSLFLIWLSVCGMVVFLGYIMAAPFFSYGDTGKIYHMLGIPTFLSYALSVMAIPIVILYFRKLTPILSWHLLPAGIANGMGRSQTIAAFLLLPLLIGTGINALISLPAPTFMSILLPFIIPLTLVPSGIRLLRSDAYLKFRRPPENGHQVLTSVHWPWILTVFLFALSRWLVHGVPL